MGNPQLPTVLVGSISREGHKIVKEPYFGVFDEEEAEKLINLQEEESDITGVPCMLDVVGVSSTVLMRYIEFVSQVAYSPFLINGPSASVRVDAANYVREVGLWERVVYDSINYKLNEKEIEAIRGAKPKAAIIQAFNLETLIPRGLFKFSGEPRQ